VSQLSQAFALATPNPEALKRRDKITYFQAVRAALAKNDASDPGPASELDYAVRQIVSRAVFADGVVDLFAAAGIARPDISVLSDEFLAEVREMPQRNLAVDLLERLLRGEVKARGRTNVVQARSFAEMIERTILQYRNRAIEAAAVLEHLIEIAREMRVAAARGEELGLTEDEVAFYDALGVNDSAVAILGDEALREIARELVETVRRNVTIDWTVRENVRANLRVLIKRVLSRRGYPPDKQERAVQQVIEQAEVLSQAWAA
jgi:type I restriction enzyme R subunit